MAEIEQAQAQVQEQERTTANNDTVSTLTILTDFVQKLNEERQESRNRGARLQKKIGETNSEIKKMTTLVAAQAGAAEDREARLYSLNQSQKSWQTKLMQRRRTMKTLTIRN